MCTCKRLFLNRVQKNFKTVIETNMSVKKSVKFMSILAVKWTVIKQTQEKFMFGYCNAHLEDVKFIRGEDEAG